MGVVDHLLQACGWHPFARTPVPNKGWIVTLDWETGVGGIIWPAMRQWIDRTVVKIDWLKKSGVEIPKALFFPNGSEIHFRSAEARREKMQGASKVAWAWFDEEIDQPVFEEVRTRLADLGGSIAVTLTPISRKAWIRDLEREEYRGRPLTKVIRASMLDAARAGLLDLQRVEQLLASLPERQRRVRELGDFAAIEGLVYPDFARDSHCLRPRDGNLYDSAGRVVYPWPLPATWPRFAAMDFGFTNPSAVVVACQDPNTDRVIVERVYYGKGLTAHKWGEFLAANLPPLECPMVADHDAFQRAELAACGVDTHPATKDVVPGLETVDRMLFPDHTGRPRLMFVLNDERDGPIPTCPLTMTRADSYFVVWEMEGYRYPERKDTDNRDPRDLPMKRDDHACFPGETLVETDSGPKPISELARAEGFVARTLNPETKEWEFRQAAASLTSPEADLLRVEWDGGFLRCTADHPILTSEGWVRASDLRPGMSLLCDTMHPEGVANGSGCGVEHLSGVRGPEVLPLRELLHGHIGSSGDAASASGGVAGESTRHNPQGVARSSPGRGPVEQLILQPGVEVERGSPSGSSDAGAPGGAARECEEGHRSGPGVASVAGGSRVASGSCSRDSCQGREGRGVMRDLWADVHVEVPDEGSVLRRDVPSRCQEDCPGREAPLDAHPQDVSGRDVRSYDSKRALSELARSGTGALPVASRVVKSVAPGGREAVYGVAVDGTRNYVAGGVVVANCDALRYLCVLLDRRTGAAPPDLGLIPTRERPLNDAVPPSPWSVRPPV